jgi:hypothetical protein
MRPMDAVPIPPPFASRISRRVLGGLLWVVVGFCTPFGIGGLAGAVFARLPDGALYPQDLPLGSVMTPIALIAGGVLVVRNRRDKRESPAWMVGRLGMLLVRAALVVSCLLTVAFPILAIVVPFLPSAPPDPTGSSNVNLTVMFEVLQVEFMIGCGYLVRRLWRLRLARRVSGLLGSWS